MLNASVNAYRRLDPHFEAPNQIKASADRSRLDGAHPHRQRKAACASKSAPSRPMRIRTWCCTRSSRPASTARSSKIKNLRQAERYLPDNIYTALEDFRKAKWTTKLLGEDVKGRYADLKQAAPTAARACWAPSSRRPEVQYHHEVYNQYLWNLF